MGISSPMKTTLSLALCGLLAALAVLPSQAEDVPKEAGVISEIDDGTITIRTDEGTRAFRIDPKLVESASLKEGQAVTLFIRSNVVTGVQVNGQIIHQRECSHDNCSCDNFKCEPACKCGRG